MGQIQAIEDGRQTNEQMDRSLYVDQSKILLVDGVIDS